VRSKITSRREVAYRCVNAACPAKRKESLLHFAGRHAMDIDGLGDKMWTSLWTKVWSRCRGSL